MKKIFGALALVTLAAGCTSDSPIGPIAKASSLVVTAQKNVVLNSRANLVFADIVNVAAAGSPPSWSQAGIKGDGRLKTGVAAGTSPSNEYQGDYCGVSGEMATTGSTTLASLNVDPDFYWTSSMQATCGSARKFNFYIAGLTSAPTRAGPHTLVDSMGVLAVGQSSTRLVRFGVQLSSCYGIRFSDEYPPSSNARITRLADVVSADGKVARKWLLESKGNHLAMCLLQGKGGRLIPNGTLYLPFALTITEVPCPSPVYP